MYGESVAAFIDKMTILACDLSTLVNPLHGLKPFI